MKKNLLAFLLLISSASLAQNTPVIQEANVSRIIKILSSDEMMGRPAMMPERIEKATAFIESEFKSIGLASMTGSSGFRQGFKNESILDQQIEVSINGQGVPAENVILYSEQPNVDIQSGLDIKTLKSNGQANKDQVFLAEMMATIADTTSAIILVDGEFQSHFPQVKSFLINELLTGKKSTKLFILGITAVNQYSIKAIQKIQSIKMNNIVGILPGKLKPEEMVIFAAHYDHIGIQPPNAQGDSIANGADDDASGTTAVIELARYFKNQNNNNRTLIFVAFTAEEIGGYGAKHFSQQINPEKVVAMFNIEMIGKPSKWGSNNAFITGYERSDFGDILNMNLKGSAFKFQPDPYPEQDLFYRSDNATLARLGVPAHSLSTDQIDKDQLYHTVDDEFESLDISNMTNTIKAIAISAQSIVEGKDTPKRIDKSTVR
jgi:hypothetical protein